MAEPSEAKQQAREMWAGGEYDDVARRIAGAGSTAVTAAGVESGEKVLDVACGTGNATIPAAQTGAEVTGLDLTPRLLEQGRDAAAKAGVEIEWVEGDAEQLPFEDASFDVVLSVFGCMFAPDHRATAAEIARVLEPGGRMAVCAWTPEGAIGRFFITVAGHMPAPPEGFQPPVLWGVEDHVTELFGGTGVELEFERAEVAFEFSSMDEAMEEATTKLPPLVAAKAALESQGRWEALRDDLLKLYSGLDTAEGDELRYAAEYLVVKGSKSG